MTKAEAEALGWAFTRGGSVSTTGVLVERVHAHRHVDGREVRVAALDEESLLLRVEQTEATLARNRGRMRKPAVQVTTGRAARR